MFLRSSDLTSPKFLDPTENLNPIRDKRKNPTIISLLTITTFDIPRHFSLSCSEKVSWSKNRHLRKEPSLSVCHCRNGYCGEDSDDEDYGIDKKKDKELKSYYERMMMESLKDRYRDRKDKVKDQSKKDLDETENSEAWIHNANSMLEFCCELEKLLGNFILANQCRPNDPNVIAAFARLFYGILDGFEKERTQRAQYFKENHDNPLILANHAKLLYEKGDIQGAMKYFSWAVLVDPEDGAIVAEYVKLVLKLRHYALKGKLYFEHVIQAGPENRYFLEAYVWFLRELEEFEGNL